MSITPFPLLATSFWQTSPSIFAVISPEITQYTFDITFYLNFEVLICNYSGFAVMR